MKKEQRTEKRGKIFLIVGITIAVLILFSSIKNKDIEITGGQVTQICPPPRGMERVYADSSDTGDYRDFTYEKNVEDAAKRCEDYGKAQISQECEDYCDPPCNGDLTQVGHTEITGFIIGKNGDYYGTGTTTTWPWIRLTKEVWEQLTDKKWIKKMGGVVAECKIKGRCDCYPPPPTEKQEKNYGGGMGSGQLQQTPPGTPQRQPRQQQVITQQSTTPAPTLSPPIPQEGFFARLWKRLFGLFIILGAFQPKKRK